MILYHYWTELLDAITQRRALHRENAELRRLLAQVIEHNRRLTMFGHDSAVMLNAYRLRDRVIRQGDAESVARSLNDACPCESRLSIDEADNLIQQMSPKRNQREAQ